MLVFSACFLVTIKFLFTDNSKKEQLENQEDQNTDFSLDTEIYVPALDDAMWVESVLARIEEERIAEELRVMEESLEEYQISEDIEIPESVENIETTKNPEDEDVEVIDSSENEEDSEEPEVLSEIEKFFIEEKTEKAKAGKNDRLAFYEFDNEVFSTHDSEGNHILIHAEKEKVNRFFYNEEYQLVKKENWNIPSAFKAVLEKTEKYEYFKDAKAVASKTITGSDSVENVKYNKDGRISSAEKYAVIEDKKNIISQRFFSYDDDGNILADELKEYFYKADDYKELDYSFTKKYLYTYNDEGIPPDFKYYENEVLKMYNKYSIEKGNYTSRIYFDEGFSVKSYYENNVRVKDVYYRNSTVIREKVYEQPEKSEE